VSGRIRSIEKSNNQRANVKRKKGKEDSQNDTWIKTSRSLWKHSLLTSKFHSISPILFFNINGIFIPCEFLTIFTLSSSPNKIFDIQRNVSYCGSRSGSSCSI
jgi:hypothetical protein